MANFVKKTKKLLLQPRKFFADRQRKIDAASARASLPKSAAAPAKKKPQHKAYINNCFTTSNKLRTHALNIFSNHTSTNFGEYRFPSDDMIIEIHGEIFTAKLSCPIENETFAKGFLLATPPETFDPQLNKNSATYLDLLHKINVDHMKSINDFNLLYSYYQTRPERNDQSQVKYALNAGIYDDTVIQKAIELLSNSNNTLHPKDLIMIFKKIYRVIGTDQKLENIANRIANLIRKDTYPVDFVMFIAAFFTESGDFRKAIEMATQAKITDPNAWTKYRYLALSHLLYSSGISSDIEIQQDHQLFLSLSKSEHEFEIYLSEYGANLAIIGNSPIEVSKAKGATIDSFTKTLRFNSAVTDYPHFLDYGRKTSVLVTNPRYYETQRNRKFELDFIVISDGNLFSTKDLYLKIHDLYQFTSNICLIPRKIDLQLTQKICASPSSGLKILNWYYLSNGPVPRSALYGFSLTDQGHGVATSYAAGKKVGLNAIHNWSSESLYLESIVSKLEATAHHV